MSFCNRCGKPLSNPKSIERGYGAVCWAKVSRKNEKNHENLDMGEREQNNYPSFQDYFQLILKDENLRNRKICGCGTKVVDADFGHYLHEYDGWWLQGWKYKQWLYFECPKCKIARAFHHLRIPRPFGDLPVEPEVKLHAQKTMEALKSENRKLDWRESRRNKEQASLKSFMEV